MKNSFLTLLILSFSFSCTSQKDNPPIFEKVSAYDFNTTIERIKEATREANWTIPNEYDMQASQKKQGHTVRPFQILVLCHSDYAREVLENDYSRQLAAIMPCRIGVYEKEDGSVYIAWSNLRNLGKKTGNTSENILMKVADEMDEIINSVVEQL